ncbi:DUF3173 family protein [Enterococcus quebecensis]|uniref:DUF3173 family protein n=1 Tax=Enterococcus quebecensis TaxID=903983 RepID=UPI000900471C|nr:DUF3173 family protein [Enterococcus quebecensis]OJG72088.1 hypothetical protein RV12_GL001060 [Enterococcus quebecensis]
MKVETCTKQDLIARGYCEYQARIIIKSAKKEMVERGCVFYLGNRVGRIPCWFVEEMLGFEFGTGKEV